jgi:uncharacterized protein (DUF1499 family)
MGRSIPGTLANGAMLLVVSMSLVSCAGKRPLNLGVSDFELAPCPSSPNCVSSDARDSAHATPPFQLEVSPAEAWPVVNEVVSGLHRVQIVEATDVYLYAECKSRLIGFVDDLELHLRPAEGVIAVRSASRVGHSDLGVNRRRLEDLRAVLISRGIIRRQ